MAARDEVYEAIRAANAAGRTEDVVRLSEYLETLTDEPATPTAPHANIETASANVTKPGTSAVAKADPSGMGANVKRVGRVAGQVAAEGVKQLFGFAALPGEAIRSGVRKLAGEDADFGRGTRVMSDLIDEYVVAPPEDEFDKKVVRIAGSGAAALAAPGSLFRNAAVGLLGGAGAEGGSHIADKVLNSGPAGTAMGGVAGSLLASAPLLFHKGRGTAHQMMQEAGKGLTPEDFRKAEELAALARARGIEVTPEQLFNKPTGIETLFNETVRAGGGKGELQALLLRQREGVEAAARQQAPGVPAASTADAARDFRGASREMIAGAPVVAPPLNPRASALMQPPVQPTMVDLAQNLPGRAAKGNGPVPLNLLSNLLNSNKNQAKEIDQFGQSAVVQARQLRAQGNVAAAEQIERAMPQAARELWQEAITKAMASKGGKTPESFGAAFADNFIGSPVKEANTKALMKAAAPPGTSDPDAYADGVVNLIKVMQAAGRNRANVAIGTTDTIKAGQGPLKTITGLVGLRGPLAQGSQVGRTMGDIAYARQYAKVADVMMSPDAVKILEKMGRTPLVSEKQSARLVALLAAANAAERGGQTPDQGDFGLPGAR